jgi:hypothetical protein
MLLKWEHNFGQSLAPYQFSSLVSKYVLETGFQAGQWEGKEGNHGLS